MCACVCLYMFRFRRCLLINPREWIDRQIHDRYCRLAREHDYRSRAAFKLKQMDDRFSFLHRGYIVLDLGCFNGGWSQVAMERCIGGHVIGIDKIKMDPLPGNNNTFIQGDICDNQLLDETLKVVAQTVNRTTVDVVLSDMAPSITGHKIDDHVNSIELCLSASDFMERTLTKGGWFIIKSFYGPETSKFKTYLNSRFESVRTCKPNASRAGSREVYYVCENFIGREEAHKEVRTDAGEAAGGLVSNKLGRDAPTHAAPLRTPLTTVGQVRQGKILDQTHQSGDIYKPASKLQHHNPKHESNDDDDQ